MLLSGTLLVLGTGANAAESTPLTRQKSAVNREDPVTRDDFNAVDENREPNQRATDILKAMGVARGDWVADVGAGAGYYSMRLSDLVGPEGKVIAEDVSDSSMEWLKRRIGAFGLTNVEVLKGKIDDPELPSDKLSAVLIVDSYHHFAQYKPLMKHVLRAIKPGRRLVIADFSVAEHRTQPRAEQLKHHEIDPALVRREIEGLGFRVVSLADPFVKRRPDAENPQTRSTDLWLMVAIRPQ